MVILIWPSSGVWQIIFPLKAGYMSIHHIIIGVVLIRHTKSTFLLKAYAAVADATRAR